MQKQDYKTVRDIADIDKYIGSADVIAFDFETSPKDEYRAEEKAALDPHKSYITGVSLSVEAGTGVYIPLRHRVGQNADIKAVMDYLRRRLTEAFAKLPPILREAYTLFQIGELSVREVAAQTGVSENLVKVRVHRAKEKLKELLADLRVTF